MPQARRSCAAEQTLRPPEQNGERQGVDEEGAEFRQQILESSVGDAQQQGGKEGFLDDAQGAHRDDDEEVDEVLQRVAWVDGEYLGTKRAAQTGEPATKCERRCEEPRGVDADRLRHAAVVDGSADARAEARSLKP